MECLDSAIEIVEGYVKAKIERELAHTKAAHGDDPTDVEEAEALDPGRYSEGVVKLRSIRDRMEHELEEQTPIPPGRTEDLRAAVSYFLDEEHCGCQQHREMLANALA